jgi:hypothetical protein
MSLWGWVSNHVVHPIAHAADAGWHDVDHFAHRVAHDATSWSEDAAHWLAKRWKPIAAALISGLVFGAVFCFCPELGPAAIAWLVPALVAGFASGAAGQAASDLLDHKTPGTDLIVPALLSAALSVGGMGIGRLALGTELVASRPALASVIANVTGATKAGEVAGDAAAATAASFGEKVKEKLGFILVNVTPGPTDIADIIKGDGGGSSPGAASAREPANEIPEPAHPVARGIVRALDLGGRDAGAAADRLHERDESGDAR